MEASYSNLKEIRQSQDCLSNSKRQLNVAFDALSDQFDEQKRFLERINDSHRIYDKELSDFYEEEYKGCKNFFSESEDRLYDKIYKDNVLHFFFFFLWSDALIKILLLIIMKMKRH